MRRSILMLAGVLTVSLFVVAPASPVQVRVEFSMDDGASFTRIGGLVNVGTIPAGGTTIAATTWKNVSPGTYLVRVTGDPNDLIKEADEANNVSDFTVNVPE
jgi:CARDB